MKHFDALIGRAASSMTQRRGEAASASSGQEDALDGLLFMGNPHETVPRALLLDQRLGAVDVLGWQMIRLLSNADRTTAFPTYDELEPLLRSGANRKASRKTVARVIAILRLTRWMTLGMKARNTGNGRMIGNVYVLHDEPLAPAESLSLDAEYIEYVIRCTRHHNRDVAEVAQLVRDELAEGGVLELPTRLDVIDQRAERQKRAEFPAETQSPDTQFPAETQPNAPSFQRKLGQFPEANSPSFQRKLMRESDTYDAVSDATRPTVRSYTNSVCKTTAREPGDTSLVWSWPLELTADERESVAFLLTGLSTETQQAVIDEAAGRVDAGKVKNTLGFLHTLAKRAASDNFQLTHFGRSVANKRRGQAETSDEQNQVVTAPVVAMSPPKPAELEPQPMSAATEQARGEMFKRLGLRR
ncbi:STY4528 family pathogenicity island replication protein [uncultured Kushneria sp.]|uniref:STY4528 family pathogenicity island replication protein n=1 Tax=uncultured Kushneria sp. TaxID=905033 RepID=UPI0026353065|nr:STY4528 family pathogenicity island replication protein [uncultured Kushneria sp.]